MAGDLEERSPASGDWKSDAASLARMGGAWLKARTELFAIEAKEASDLTQKRARWAGTGFALLSLGYILFLAGLIGWISQRFSVSWTLISMAVGALHIIPGVLFLTRSAGAKEPLFEETRNELKKDQEWLKEIQSANSEKHS